MKKRKRGKTKTPLPPETLAVHDKLRKESADLWDRLQKKAEKPKLT